MSYEQIIYTKEDRVAIISLNRPQVFNAFTPIMIDEWVRAIETAKLAPEVRAVVVTGARAGVLLRRRCAELSGTRTLGWQPDCRRTVLAAAQCTSGAASATYPG
jgi:hypothetical protein